MPASRDGLLAAICIFAPVTLTVVLMRVWAIYLRKRTFKIHDYLVFIAEISSLAFDGMEIAAWVKGGMGKHESDVPLADVEFMSRVFLIGGYFWLITTSAAKLSILCLMLEIFGPMKSLRIGVYCMMTLVSLFTLAMLLSFSLHCRPFEYNWNQAIPGHCGDVAGEVKASAAANLGLDILIFLLPQRATWQLQMSVKRKMIVSGIFVVGLLVCMVNLLRVANGDAPGGADYTYRATNDALYSLLEAWLSVIVACLAVLQPVFSKLFFFTTKSLSNKWSTKSTRALQKDTDPSSTQSKHLDRARFQRLDDAYELEDGLHAKSDASAIATRVDSVSAGPLPRDDDTITVQRDLHVHAEHVGGPRRVRLGMAAGVDVD